MKITKLLNQYKAIARSMKAEAKNYSRLRRAVMTTGSTKETYQAYRQSWEKLIELNDEAYWIMLDYRELSESLWYRILFTLGIVPRQNGFRYIDDKKCQFNATQLINVVNY